MNRASIVATCAAVFVLASCEDASAPNNHRPHLAGIADQAMAVGATAEVPLSATDADGDALAFDIVSNPGFLSVEDVEQTGDLASAMLMIAPLVGHAGNYTGRVRVTDGRGGEHTQDFAIEAIAPERGEWWGTADFGVISLVVNPQRSDIIFLHVLLLDWRCGAVSVSDGFFIDYPSGWPISAGHFAIERTLNQDVSMTVWGDFASSTSASGTFDAVVYGTECPGVWEASWLEPGAELPSLAVFMSPDFSYSDGVLGYGWRPGVPVTLEVDNAADGSVDYERTGTTDAQGNLNFRDYGSVAPFSVFEGDSVRLHDDATTVDYTVVYLTLDDVDLDADVLSGSAREGTEVEVRVFNPALPFPEGPELIVIAGAGGRWVADFGGIFDIVDSSGGWAIAHRGFGHTQIDWQLPLGGM